MRWNGSFLISLFHSRFKNGMANRQTTADDVVPFTRPRLLCPSTPLHPQAKAKFGIFRVAVDGHSVLPDSEQTCTDEVKMSLSEMFQCCTILCYSILKCLLQERRKLMPTCCWTFHPQQWWVSITCFDFIALQIQITIKIISCKCLKCS